MQAVRSGPLSDPATFASRPTLTAASSSCDPGQLANLAPVARHRVLRLENDARTLWEPGWSRDPQSSRRRRSQCHLASDYSKAADDAAPSRDAWELE